MVVRTLMTNGGGYPIVVEPRTVLLEYPARWQKPRIDLEELAKLRQAGWQTRQLAAHFGVSISAVKTASGRLRAAKGKCTHPVFS